MRIHTYIVLAIVGLLSCTPHAAVLQGEPDANVVVDASAEAAPTSKAGSPTPEPIVIPEPSSRLIDYVSKAMQTWRPSHDDAYYTSIAHDIASVAVSEPPVFTKDLDHAQSAILLAAVAFWETGYVRWVDDGTCNDAAKMKAARVGWTGACDGGLAVSLWQVHPDQGFILTDDGGWRWRESKDSGGIMRQDMLASRQTSARVALHIMRQSLRNGAGLCQYSGEEGPCPKADMRLNFAKRYSAAHPF